MRKVAMTLLTFALGVAFAVFFLNGRDAVEGQAQPAAAAGGFSAVANAVGTQDVTGPYEVVKGWPKDISTLPGNEKWTYGAGESVFAESPNRVFMLFRGELPNMHAAQGRAAAAAWSEHQLPGRGSLARCDDRVAARRRRHRSGHPEMADGVGRQRRRDRHQGPAVPQARRRRAMGALPRRLLTPTATSSRRGSSGTSCSAGRTRSTSARTTPEKHVWVVDDNMQVIYMFTHDGKQLVQTIGTPEKEGADATHFNRPTFIDWLPDGTFFVSDGYTGTRVAKFDKNGKFVMQWGIKGNPPNENAARLHEQRAWRRRRSGQPPRVRQRSQQPPHPGVRRERQVPLRVEHQRGSVEPAPALHRAGPQRLDLRSQHATRW